MRGSKVVCQLMGKDLVLVFGYSYDCSRCNNLILLVLGKVCATHGICPSYSKCGVRTKGNVIVRKEKTLSKQGHNTNLHRVIKTQVAAALSFILLRYLPKSSNLFMISYSRVHSLFHGSTFSLQFLRNSTRFTASCMLKIFS
jgi:hypothetical protein